MILHNTTGPIDLDTLSVDELNRYWQEERTIRGRTANSTRYALAMLRRAAEGSQDAWICYYHAYEALVHAWILRGGSALDQDERMGVANEAWGKFARQMTLAKLLQFNAYARVMHYLKLCAQSATVDALRAQQHFLEHEEMLTDAITWSREQPHADPGKTLEHYETLSEVERIVWRTARTEDEQLLATLVFLQGEPVRDVCQRYPAQFPNARQVYQALRTMRERLQRNKDLLLLLTGQGDTTAVSAAGRKVVAHA